MLVEDHISNMWNGIKRGNVSTMEINSEKDLGRRTIPLAEHVRKESLLKLEEFGRPLYLKQQRYKVTFIDG